MRNLSRLAYAVTPRPEALRAMTADALRDEIAAMWERLGHTVINSLAAPEIVTIKGERKCIVYAPIRRLPTRRAAAQYGTCATGLLPPVPSADCMSPCAVFTAEAQQFADTVPIQMIDGSRGEKAPFWVMVPTRNV